MISFTIIPKGEISPFELGNIHIEYKGLSITSTQDFMIFSSLATYLDTIIFCMERGMKAFRFYGDDTSFEFLTRISFTKKTGNMIILDEKIEIQLSIFCQTLLKATQSLYNTYISRIYPKDIKGWNAIGLKSSLEKFKVFTEKQV